MKYAIQDEPIVISKATIDSFLKEGNPADLIALYLFYYYTAKWQKTNQPKATDNYCMQGLRWGYNRYCKAHKQLIKLGLIQRVKKRDDTTGKITGWYIKVNFIWKEETLKALESKEINQNSQNPELVKSRTGKQSTNALSANNRNALIDNKEILQNFSSFYFLYPDSKRKEKTEFEHLKNTCPDYPDFVHLLPSAVQWLLSERNKKSNEDKIYTKQMKNFINDRDFEKYFVQMERREEEELKHFKSKLPKERPDPELIEPDTGYPYLKDDKIWYIKKEDGTIKEKEVEQWYIDDIRKEVLAAYNKPQIKLL